MPQSNTAWIGKILNGYRPKKGRRRRDWHHVANAGIETLEVRSLLTTLAIVDVQEITNTEFNFHATFRLQRTNVDQPEGAPPAMTFKVTTDANDQSYTAYWRNYGDPFNLANPLIPHSQDPDLRYLNIQDDMLIDVFMSFDGIDDPTTLTFEVTSATGYGFEPDYEPFSYDISNGTHTFPLYGYVEDDQYQIINVEDITPKAPSEKPIEQSDNLNPCSCSCSCSVGTPKEMVLTIEDGKLIGIVTLDVTFSGDVSDEDTVIAKSYLNGIEHSEIEILMSDLDSGKTKRQSFSFDLSGQPLEELSYAIIFDSDQLTEYTHSGTIDNGPRPIIKNLAQLSLVDDGVSVSHNGERSRFQQISGGSSGAAEYSSEAGDFSKMIRHADDSFTLTDRHGRKVSFDLDGRQVSRIDPNGRETTYSYIDANGNGTADALYQVVSDAGETVTLGYDLSGRLISMTDKAGRSTSYTYDVQGRIATVTTPDPDGSGPLSALIKTYGYDSNNHVISISESNGLVTQYIRDSYGYIEEEIHPDGSSIQYSNFHGQTLPGNGEGTTGNPILLVDLEEVWGAVTDPSDVTWYYAEDKFGNVIREKDALGNITIYERDENGLLTKLILPDPDGENGPAVLPVYEYTYDSRGNMLTETLPDSSVRTWEYHPTWNQATKYTNANGNVTLYTYDTSYPLILSETRVIGLIDDEINLETDDLTTSFIYTSDPILPTDPPRGLTESIIAPDGVVTEFEYDQYGNLTVTTYAVGTSDEASTSATYDLAGNVLTRTDELGNTTTYTYDAWDRLTSVTTSDPDGAGPLDARITTLTYNEMGFLANESVNGRTTQYIYNALGQLITVTEPDPDGAGPQSAPVTSHTYHSDGNLATVTDPLGNVTTYTYTDGLLTSITEPDLDGAGPQSAPVTSFTYDDAGRMLTMTDALGHTTNYTYDNLGRLVSTTLPDPDGAGPLTALSDQTEFDLLGRVVAYTDFHGVTTSYTYDAEGNTLTEITPLGTTTFEYDELGRLISETSEDPDAAGPLTALVTIYAYTAVGQLASVTTPSGTTSYEYDNRRRQTKITLPDPDGNGSEEAPVTSFTYDAVGNLLTETDPLGNVTTYIYDDLDRVIEIIAPDPDGAGPLSSPVTSYEYDDLGQLVAIIDPNGGVTSFEYDDLGRLINEILPDPDGAGPQSTPEINYVYDANNQLIAETDVLGNTTTYEYDNLGRLVTITLPDPDGTGLLAAPVITFEYDALGQLLSETDPLGRVTNYAYDAMGRILTETLPDPDSGGPLDAPVTTYTHGADGRLASVEDADGQLVNYTYTAAGQVATITDPRGVTTHTYDALGRTISIVEPDPDGAGPAIGPFTHYDYDDRGMVSAITTPDGTTVYLYNNLGYLAQVTTPGSSDGLQKASRTTYIYDVSGNLISEFDGKRAENQNANQFDVNNDGVVNEDDFDALVYAVENGFPEGYFYDINGNGFFTLHDWNLMITYIANVHEVYDFPTLYWHPGNHTQYEYDNLNRLIKKIDAEGGETTYSYDANGNRLSLTDPVGNTTAWEYDYLNRLTTETNRLEDTRHYAYDLAGNILEYTDRNGRVTEYTYDNLQRRIGETWLDGVTPIHTLEYAYDAASQLTTAGDSHAEYTFSYDNLGRVISTEHDLDVLGFSVTLDQAYDALNRRISLSAEIDETADLINQYEYDFLGRMTQVTQSGQSGGNAVAEKRVDFAYDPLDVYRYESITRYADLSGTKMVAATDYDYDANNRLVALTHSDSLSATLAGYTWAYDSAGRLTQFTVAGYSDEDAEYTYDNTNQLVGADRDGTTGDESYTYDENGNRIGGGYTVGDNNQLLSDGTFNYTYDAEGNRLTKTEIATDYVTEYEWDYRNRLTAIIQKDDLGVILHEVQYTYDIFNHRIVKTIDADGAGIGDPTQEIYIYDGLRQERGNAGDHILLAFDEEGDLTHRYLHGPNVDQVLAAEEVADPEVEGDVLWALTDHLGSVRDLAEYDDGTDATTVVNHITYDAFGNITSETNAAVDFLFGFTGRERDAESDLQFNRARYYDAAIGRWISEDPIGFEAGDENLVRYVGNGVVNATDPSGLDGKKTVETGVKGIQLFIEWLPNRNTAEMKILTKRGAELAIVKWMVNRETGAVTGHIVARHGGKVLPGVAQATLRKITPKIAQEMADNVARIGGNWVLTRLADATRTGGRVSLGKASGTGLKFGIGLGLSAIGTWFSMQNTCQAAEIEQPVRKYLDWQSLGINEDELLELSDATEKLLPPDQQRWLEEDYQAKLRIFK